MPHDRARNHRARFEAVRREVFLEMERASTRWRFAWFVPFNLVIIGLLWIRGEGTLRVGIQLGSLAAALALGLISKSRSASEAPALAPFLFGALHYFIGLGVTGGIASPLLPVGLPLMSIGAIVLEERAKAVKLAAFLALGYAVLAGGTLTHLFGLPAPLFDDAGRPTLEYALLGGGTVIFAVVSLNRLGFGVTEMYRRIALELATRREEIYEESQDQTRSFEGVAARLAHEVKNPLAAIKGLSLHVARSTPDEKAAERLSIVAQEADRLRSIVDGFLDFSRGLDELKLGPARPYEIARELVILLETRAAESDVKLEVIGDERAEIPCDARKLRQALLNIVLNAIQASPRGDTVTMHVARTKEGTLRIRVIDRGSGMTPEVLDRIRRPYFTTRAAGSGLGVAMARALVEQHGGRLSFESSTVPERSGTTVSIELPAEPHPTETTALPMRPQSPPNEV
jgi:signal transduction histidine kinase